MSMHSIDGAQGRLAVSANNHGGGEEPMLFVHADAGNLHQWDDIRARFADRTTAAFDRRGHGQSDMPKDGVFDHGAGSEDIRSVANSLGFSRFVLIGHSGGALSAFTFASAHPEFLSALVLVDPPGDPKALPPGLLDQQMEAMRKNPVDTLQSYYRSIAGDNAAVVERVLADARATRSETVIASMEALARFQPPALKPDMASRTLSIIQSRFDAEGALHRLPPGFSHVVIDGAGHWIQLGAPERFTTQLRGFLTRRAAA